MELLQNAMQNAMVPVDDNTTRRIIDDIAH
jgi:hypothetical protein